MIRLEFVPARAMPTEPGWYVVLERGNKRPLTLWVSHASRDWRAGAQKVHATHYAGPIAMPRDVPL